MATAAEFLVPHRWTREQYDRVVATGALDHMRVELIGGAIVEMTPQGGPHADVVEVLTMLLAPAMRHARVRVQSPLAATDDSEPEPDLLVAPIGARPGHPSTGSLAIEVVVSRRLEAQVKEPIYAAAGITEYWIVDVPRRVVEVLTNPSSDGYGDARTLRGADVLGIPEFGISFTLDELFAEAGLGRS